MSYRYRIALVFLTGFFIDCINIFMPAVALPRLAAEFEVASLDTAWVGNAYILGLTLVIPISTWLASRWGARRLLAASMLVFALAVAACGMAGSFAAVVGWRFVQGMAGGLLIPVGQAMAFAPFQGGRARTHFHYGHGRGPDCTGLVAGAGRADCGQQLLALGVFRQYSVGSGCRAAGMVLGA
ncbi:MFS transporter [Comamonas sp.]|uniref:MFS transporter n=1 Tax=Comamonas sp. TaxID=34028 RepID=UPI000B215CC8